MAEGDAEQGEVEHEVGGQDGEDVELVSRVVVVEVVPGLPIGQPELVPQPQSLQGGQTSSPSHLTLFRYLSN